MFNDHNTTSLYSLPEFNETNRSHRANFSVPEICRRKVWNSLLKCIIVIKWPKEPAGIHHLHCLIITQPNTFGQAGQSIQSSSFLSDVSNFMEESRWEYILKIKHLTVISMHLLYQSALIQLLKAMLVHIYI